jgi:class 3 adenylate cyclase/predicted alpha/beta hydrolase family esterase
MTPPETRYAGVGADRVAYHVFGDVPRDLVSTFGLWSNLNSPWADPGGSRFLRALSGFSRVIRFDRRGSGLSDPRPDDASVLDHWIEDLIAVLDAADSRRAVILANSDSGPLVLHALDRHPERIDGLVLGITTASLRAAPGYPGFSDAEIERLQEFIRSRWGTEAFSALFTPSRADDPEAVRAQARAQQAMAAPRAVSQNLEAAAAIDARHILPRVAVPTLVIGRRDCRMFPLAQSRYMAEHIPGAQWLELPGADAIIAGEGVTESLSAIEALMTGERRRIRRAGQLASMLFTDIVAATRMANDLGNRDWRERLDAHDRLVRLQANLHGGVLVDSAGDGSFMRFAHPADAIDCAQALHEAMQDLQLDIRAGVHLGDVELRDDGRIGGLSVHIGARVAALPDAGETWVSRTVRDVLLGSDYRFQERGIHSLKGVPSKWPLYRVRHDANDAAVP